MQQGDDQASIISLGILYNPRLVEAGIDTFCRVWYDGGRDPTWFMWNSCQVWVDDDSDGVNVSPGDCVTQGTRNTQLNLQQKMVVSELKMKIEMLESKLQMREEQIDSLKAELNRLNTFLMLERRSVFARLRDYLVGRSPVWLGDTVVI